MSQTTPQTNPRRVGDLSPTRQPTRNRCTAWVTACSLTHPTQLRQATTEEHSVVQPASTTAAKRPSPAPVIPAQAGIHALRVGCIASRLRGSDKTGQGNRMFGINI